MTTATGELAAIGWTILDRFRIGDAFAISPHGLGIALGFLAGATVFTAREAPRRGYPDDVSNSLVFWALVGTIVGSRLGYVLTHLDDFRSVVDVLAVHRGGLSQLGGVVGAVLLGYVILRRRRLPFLPALDAAAIPAPLGVVIGRVGDLIIGDHLGRPTSWLLAWRYSGGPLPGFDCAAGRCSAVLSGDYVQVVDRAGATLLSPAGEVVASGVGVHQTALYDLGIAMLLVLVLVGLNGRPRRPGVLFLTYVAWYGTGRLITDLLRIENRFFGLTGSQWTSAVAVAFALGTLAWFALHPLRERRPATVDASATGEGVGDHS